MWLCRLIRKKSQQGAASRRPPEGTLAGDVAQQQRRRILAVPQMAAKGCRSGGCVSRDDAPFAVDHRQAAKASGGYRVAEIGKNRECD